MWIGAGNYALMRKRKIHSRSVRDVHSNDPPKVYVAEWLALLDIKPAEVAKATGIGESMLSLAGDGKRNYSLVNLNKISIAINVPIGRLFEPPPSSEALQTLGRYSQEELERFRRT